jgi:hypothetical protein
MLIPTEMPDKDSWGLVSNNADLQRYPHFGIRDMRGDQGTDQPYAHYQLFPHSQFYTEGTLMVGLGFDL